MSLCRERVDPNAVSRRQKVTQFLLLPPLNQPRAGLPTDLLKLLQALELLVLREAVHVSYLKLSIDVVLRVDVV